MPIHGYPGNIITANPTAPTVSSASGVWTTEQQLINQSAGNWPMAATQISRSLRFNSADSAYLNRSFVSTPTTFTLSFWVKRSNLGTTQRIFGARAAGSIANSISFTTSDILEVYSFQQSLTLNTTAVFRDISAWYHFVVSTTTGNTTVYYNGTQIATSATAWRLFNSAANGNSIGRDGDNAASFFNGYLTEVNFIDGQALTPANFGFYDSNTGIWTPRQYTGPYGTNGFYLNFSDNSGTTATTLGKDYSGNGNNWTPNNFSVTAGAGNDSLVDTPTSYGIDTGAGGEVRGNYATFSPIIVSSQGQATLANGNLNISGSGANYVGCVSSFAMSTGKWYWEYKITGSGTGNGTGIVATDALRLAVGANYGYADAANSRIRNGTIITGNASSLVTGLSTIGLNDVIGVAVDFDSGKIWFSRNNTWESSGNPASGTNATTTFTTGKEYYACAQAYNTWSGEANFGQRPFAYTAPSGFKALCTQNLPTPTIGATSTTQANDYFDVSLYTGTGSSLNITGLQFQPDWVWIKGRSGATDHGLYDAVRGVQKQLESNQTGAETTETTGLTAFNSDGFTVGALAQLNTNTATYVAWNWNAGGSNATNTSGTITSTVRANTTAGFSIVTYTGTGVAATVGHGLGVAPSMIIVKSRSLASSNWPVYHISIPATNYLRLNTTAASAASSATWNNTAPTSTVFSQGADYDVGQSSATYVAYCFAPVAGFSAFGSYTGNGSADGPFVYTGFRPRYVMVKCSSAIDSWDIWDTSRNTYNVVDARLYAQLANAETTSTQLDILSNGFKLRSTNSETNTSTATYIYAAFAESPFKYSLAR